MGTLFKDKNEKRILRELTQPFKQIDLEFRPQQVGYKNNKPYAILIAYVTNRAIQTRLDDVVGCMNWRNEYLPLPNSVGDGAMCGIAIKHGGEWIAKYDGADNTNIESTKGGLSGAMKRAAVQWGIGRYLYDIPPLFADCLTPDEFKALKYEDKAAWERAKDKNDQYLYWKPKKLDAKYLPQKYVEKVIVESIEKLIKETETDESEVLEFYGVEDIRDLYGSEAGQLVTLLTKKQQRQKEEEDAK